MNKTIYAIALLISLPVFAGGFVAESKINECSRTAYVSQSKCQEIEAESCYQLPEEVADQCGVLKLRNLHSEQSVNEESCSGEEECEELLISKVCSVNHTAFISEDFSSVYCREITGKDLIVDEVKLVEKQVERAALAQANALIANGRKAREDCLKVLDLIGGFNLLPGRSSEQAGEMALTFAAAKALLQDGRPGAAKTAIQAIPVDGVLVSQPMKDLALEQLKDW